MSISEQVKELRELADGYKMADRPLAANTIYQSADTIESLSAKQENAYYVKRNGKDDVIVSIMYNKADNKYHFVNLSKNHICTCGFETTEEAIADMEQRKNNGSICDFYLIEQSAEDCGGWIPCKDRLPTKEECIKSDCRFIVSDGNRVHQGIFDYDINHFVWFNCNGTQIDEVSIAWMPLPEPYHEP